MEESMVIFNKLSECSNCGKSLKDIMTSNDFGRIYVIHEHETVFCEKCSEIIFLFQHVDKNQERSDRVKTLLQISIYNTESPYYDDKADSMADFLSDIQHFCYQEGFDFESLLGRATRNFEAEINGED